MRKKREQRAIDALAAAAIRQGENNISQEEIDRFMKDFKMKRYWVSWSQPTEDYRPIYKRKAPLGGKYWCSGSGDGYWTMCAVVDAESEAGAKRLILKYWPEASEWRFCDEKAANWMPPKDRFI